MKILDKIGSWIDKLDAKIFRKENYQPLAGQGFVAALKTAVGVGIVLFLVQMFTTGRTLENWTAGIGAACILIAMVMKTLPNFLGQTLSIGAKIGYGFFCFFLASFALQLAMYIVMLLLIILVLYIAFFFMGGSTGKSGKATRDDCYYCEIRGAGRRACLKESGYEGREVECNSSNPVNCPHYIKR